MLLFFDPLGPEGAYTVLVNDKPIARIANGQLIAKRPITGLELHGILGFMTRKKLC